MRIAVFCNDFWPTIGGVQTGVWGLARALGRHGHRTMVLTRQPPDAPPVEVVDDVEVRRFRWNLRPHTSFPVRALRSGAQVLHTVRQWRPSVIFVHFVSVHALYAWMCAESIGVPMILSFRGNDALRIAERSWINRVVYRLLARAADVSLFCSPWLRDQTGGTRWFRGVGGRVGLLEDAVEVSHREPVPPSEPPYVLAAGRLVPKKGFDMLLRAWAAVGARIPAELWIAGDGPEDVSLRELASEIGLGRRVRFLGAVPHARLLGLLEQAALCIVPSREEPYGIIVVEAQALGVPVLACAVGNTPCLIHDGVTGYLADPTAEGLARGLVRAWTDPGRSQLAAAARTAPGAVRSYDAMAQELEAWVSLVTGPAPGRC